MNLNLSGLRCRCHGGRWRLFANCWRSDLQFFHVFAAEDGHGFFLLVRVLEAVLGKVINAEDPRSRLRSVFNESSSEFYASLLEFIFVVEVGQFFGRLDGLLLSLVNRPHLVQGDLSPAVETFAMRRLLVVVWKVTNYVNKTLTPSYVMYVYHNVILVRVSICSI